MGSYLILDFSYGSAVLMSGKALPFQEISPQLLRLCLIVVTFRGIASQIRGQIDEKAKPFRSSAGEALWKF
ncbi:MAG: hypothetical protein K1X72_15675 [Pyrinomonadaceae bacterium]|nr:hypothetical protein [Pyrinomonadaceae bacterium]